MHPFSPEEEKEIQSNMIKKDVEECMLFFLQILISKNPNILGGKQNSYSIYISLFLTNLSA